MLYITYKESVLRIIQRGCCYEAFQKADIRCSESAARVPLLCLPVCSPCRGGVAGDRQRDLHDRRRHGHESSAPCRAGGLYPLYGKRRRSLRLVAHTVLFPHGHGFRRRRHGALLRGAHHEPAALRVPVGHEQDRPAAAHHHRKRPFARHARWYRYHRQDQRRHARGLFRTYRLAR